MAPRDHLRRDALRQGPPFHGGLVLHVLDLLLQCVLVHGGEYTGIHGNTAAPPLSQIGRTGWRVRLHRKINKDGLRVAIGCYLLRSERERWSRRRQGEKGRRLGPARERERPRAYHRDLSITGEKRMQTDTKHQMR